MESGAKKSQPSRKNLAKQNVTLWGMTAEKAWLTQASLWAYVVHKERAGGSNIVGRSVVKGVVEGTGEGGFAESWQQRERVREDVREGGVVVEKV